ncbi:hypothetical protein NGTWS0302_38250 [Mycolicibacterium cyprinidarum]|uniref:N-acetyltransferase n=1 Tax=Mycolicibacterium cyprinidarum TaxID=2860311 RepID=A0ABQ4V5M7_9MYCO|nr:hypothetical protein NGTWS1702_06230 [Mycolicibacterium sp. NGTWSNA01]GJF15252.1 hypothetical protein NGTWS0302_38250 [Mycolicibacterium sp. NGTWS0302]
MDTDRGVEIRLASRRDITGLTALEARYYIGNLDTAEHPAGFISILHSPEWFGRAIDSGGVHVAVTEDDAVVGFIVVTAPPDRGEAGLPPIVRAILDLTETLEISGKPIAQQRFALRGPVCIAEEVRGRGVYSAFNAVTLEAYWDRFDLGVLFVAADNPRSLHTTTTKLGAQSLAVFEADGRQFHLLVFDFVGCADG